MLTVTFIFKHILIMMKMMMISFMTMLMMLLMMMNFMMAPYARHLSLKKSLSSYWRLSNCHRINHLCHHDCYTYSSFSKFSHVESVNFALHINGHFSEVLIGRTNKNLSPKKQQAVLKALILPRLSCLWPFLVQDTKQDL